jgi:hypothetical protein
MSNKKKINPDTITGKIFLNIFELLEGASEGIRWKDLQLLIESAHPEFHPKTINGCIWQLTNKFPGEISKPSKGLFKIIKPQ